MTTRNEEGNPVGGKKTGPTTHVLVGADTRLVIIFSSCTTQQAFVPKKTLVVPTIQVASA